MFVTLYALISYMSFTHRAGANVNAINVRDLTETNFIGQSKATTTQAYLRPGTALATTTYVLYTEQSDINALNLTAVSSTSAAVFGWQYAYSNDPSCSTTANCNWFEEDIPAQYGLANGISTQDHASTTITHRWNPGSTIASTTYKTIPLPQVAARYTLVRFFMVNGSATNGSINARAALKSINNQ